MLKNNFCSLFSITTLLSSGYRIRKSQYVVVREKLQQSSKQDLIWLKTKVMEVEMEKAGQIQDTFWKQN